MTQPLPPLSQLGEDLTRITIRQRVWGLAVPFLCVAAYAGFAGARWWPAAVLALMYLSFVTYGSISHDLVHRNLGMSRRWNDRMLCAIELLTLRSGHAYRLVHLHHHARFPHEDDLEGRAARMSLLGALVDGVTLQPRVWFWAIRRAKRDRAWIIGEGLGVMALASAAIALWPVTSAPLVYAVLIVMGSWIIPVITAYIPHDAAGRSPLFQTRLFRGRVASIVALEHLYHLEHHLYPSVPHQKWPELARRLDPYFDRAGVVPITLTPFRKRSAT
ncbi:hypothetical protein CCAX7_20850 [Capsulimonas corticalis]|uniref:Uncharacterized protein n=1 Tax=Capsulimonas corticalis TaxID=2219043 RepID=A0A402D2C8_9BACT|nr:fatty acid desaturase [Capsulimonas corticalis]BDI30034.1 hypothetical protein CCAX7_20850 [Capsulimonas corticalis]